MSYLRAVLNDDKKLERKYLEQLVVVGKQLKRNTLKYEKELKQIGTVNSTKKKTAKIIKKPISSKLNSLYNIQSVTVKGNAIVINFKYTISKNSITFFEQHYKKLHKDIFNIKGRFKDAAPTKLKMDGVGRITISQYKDKVLRITLSNPKDLKTVYIVNKKQILIKVLGKKSTKVTRAKLAPTKTITHFNRHKTIVIDSGHGGKDSGAVGPKKRYEKHVVLKVSKYLFNELKKRGYKVYSTRSTDRFIKVKNRTILANKKHADIFLSIHANAAPKSHAYKARGIETYFLSPAKSARAKRVAALENRSDIRKMNYNSKTTFLTILNQSKITASQKLGIDVQQNILYNVRKKYSGVVDGGVREGPFWVLVGAQMPSILVEVGYITHKQESQRLYNTHYQQLLAQGIANGIDAYFAKNP